MRNAVTPSFFLLALLGSVALSNPATAPSAPQVADVATHLQSVSCTIHAGGAQGSGVIVRRGEQNFVLTAAHVVSGLRSVREIVDGKTGATRKVIEFKDVKVVSELIEGGRSVGKIELDAEVIRYSNAETGHDLALLRVRKKDAIKASAKFYLDERIPAVGTDLLHCGSLLGQVGSNSITTGVISQHGRLINGIVFDQVSATIFSGSSGGGVYIKSDGRLVGLVVRGAGETFGLVVPARRIVEWAGRAGVAFVLDESVAVPDDAKLREQPVDDDGR